MDVPKQFLSWTHAICCPNHSSIMHMPSRAERQALPPPPPLGQNNARTSSHFPISQSGWIIGRWAQEINAYAGRPAAITGEGPGHRNETVPPRWHSLVAAQLRSTAGLKQDNKVHSQVRQVASVDSVAFHNSLRGSGRASVTGLVSEFDTRRVETAAEVGRLASSCACSPIQCLVGRPMMLLLLTANGLTDLVAITMPPFPTAHNPSL